MHAFDFLLGSWDLFYDIPESSMSEAATGKGTGEFRKVLNDKYVFLDYRSIFGEEQGAAHGVFCLEEQEGIYHYWWFENSGKYLQASCKFVDDETLYMNWHDTVLSQTFKKIDDDTVLLTMQQPASDKSYETVLKVTFKRR